MFGNCNHLLKKIDLVTDQLKRIQDKFTFLKSFEDDFATSTKPWTKSKKFINLSSERKNLQKSLRGSTEMVNNQQIKADLKSVNIKILNLYKKKNRVL